MSIAPPQSVAFPPLCNQQCTPFGNDLLAKCITRPTNVIVLFFFWIIRLVPLHHNTFELTIFKQPTDTANQIGLCFCTEYGAAGGVDCLTCIGNNYANKNSTSLFESLGTACHDDASGVEAGKMIMPVIHDAVMQNAAGFANSTTTASMSSTMSSSGVTVTSTGKGVMTASGAAAVSASMSSRVSSGVGLAASVQGVVMGGLVAAVLFLF
ncbi:hypothetical protein BC830DRAFT_1107763 [Chytriomyces sp. MP71]|nr:hypothetical protein BC830DRAFT_1107763 [Chytriomyces sp. MP71]